MSQFLLNIPTLEGIALLPVLRPAAIATCNEIAEYRGALQQKYPEQAKKLRLRQASMGASSGKAIARTIQHLQPTNIFEIGTCAGIGAAYMCTAAELAGNPVNFVGMEGVPQKTEIALATLDYFCENTNIHIEQGHFDDTFEIAVQKALPLQFVYLDGRHKKPYTQYMFNHCVKNMPQGGLIICDDLYQPLQGDVATRLRRHPRVVRTLGVANKLAFVVKEDDDAAARADISGAPAG